jgi:glutamine amidotransferase
MQFLFECSEEGDEPGLGWFSGSVLRFDDGVGQPKVPHIGWNDVRVLADSCLFAGIESAADFYFVHSYYVPLASEAGRATPGVCHYGVDFAAACERGNIFACQFHPEKSQLAGMKLLQNFLAIEPERA